MSGIGALHAGNTLQHVWNTQLVKNIFAVNSNKYMPMSITSAPKSINLVPLRNNVLLIPATAPIKSQGGIIIPTAAKEAPLRGRVVSVGKATAEVKPGDTVLFEKYAGTTLVIANIEHLLVSEDNIVGVVEG